MQVRKQNEDGFIKIIGGQYKGKKLKCPPSTLTRPTSHRARESLFNILEHTYGIKNKTVLDVFAGTGAFGFEAFSRGASNVTFIEKNKEVLKILKQHSKEFSIRALAVMDEDVLNLTTPSKSNYDIVFLDPPYDLLKEEMCIQQLIEKGYIDQQTLIILEADKSRKFIHSFQEMDQRIYGRNKFYFLKLGE